MVWKIYGVEDDMVNWLETSVTTALAEWILLKLDHSLTDEAAYRHSYVDAV